MICDSQLLRRSKIFEALDDDEASVLAGQVELKEFKARQRIYKSGETKGKGYVVVEGMVEITTIDEQGQQVILDTPTAGEFFGFASMLEGTPHRTTAYSVTDSICIEVDPEDIRLLLEKKPMAGLDIMAVLARQYHTAHELVRLRAQPNPNELIDEQATTADRIADGLARLAGSWFFIISFLVSLVIYSIINIFLGDKAWDPYPFILLNLILSMLAALQAPVIMMSQNRQDKRDRLRSELDYDVNRRAAGDIQGLARKLNLMDEKINDLEEHIRR